MNRVSKSLYTLIWFIWPLATAFFWLFWLASLPGFFSRVDTNTVPTVLASGLEQVSPEIFAEAATAWNISVSAWSRLDTLINGISLLVFTLIAGLIWWRVRTWFGLLTALVLSLGGSSVMGNAIRTAPVSTDMLNLWNLGGLIWPLFFLWLYLFPDGRPVPRRLFWIFLPFLALFAGSMILLIAADFIPGFSSARAALINISRDGSAIIVPLFLLVVSAQVYRYIRISKAVERDQTKWFLFALLIVVFPIDLFVKLPGEIGTILFMALPIGIGIAILRYRLWDIDVIIRRTLIYGGLTLTLAVVYFGSVVLLQALFQRLAGGQSTIAIVLSTLLIAALFTPLRWRIQRDIDRRFYRRRYDAQRTLEAFAASLRNQVELEQLTGQFLAVVEETMQPENVSLWLKLQETKKNEQQGLQLS